MLKTRKNANKNPLDIAEENDLLDEVYELAKALFCTH
jgi:hypothetical protein